MGRWGPSRHRIGEARKSILAIEPFLTTHVLSLKVRLQRPRANILPVLAWGAPAWHLRKDCLITADGAIMLMARITMHDIRPAIEEWFDRHFRTWRSAREYLMAAWGCVPL